MGRRSRRDTGYTEEQTKLNINGANVAEALMRSPHEVLRLAKRDRYLRRKVAAIKEEMERRSGGKQQIWL